MRAVLELGNRKTWNKEGEGDRFGGQGQDTQPESRGESGREKMNFRG